MQLDQILAKIRDNYANESNEIDYFVEQMAKGKLGCRKQLSDMICNLPAKLSVSEIHEISKWGVNDNLSLCEEVRNCVK